MKTKTIKTGLMFALLFAASFSATVAHAQLQDGGNGQTTFPNGGPVMPDPHGMCAVPKIDGDKVPFPLKAANTKFELAENETYILNGTIVAQGGKMLFRVDFTSQPWLATQKRAQFPYFLINATDSVVQKLNGSLVQMAVVVRKNEVAAGGQEGDSGMYFDLITPPLVIQRR